MVRLSKLQLACILVFVLSHYNQVKPVMRQYANITRSLFLLLFTERTLYNRRICSVEYVHSKKYREVRMADLEKAVEEASKGKKQGIQVSILISGSGTRSRSAIMFDRCNFS